MKVAERIHLIPTPTPFPVGVVNAYLIADEPLTLIDSGVKTEEALEALRSGLAAMGIRFGDIEQLLITHSHLDHYGLMASVAAEGNPRVYAHPLEVYDVENPHGYAAANDERYQRIERFLLRSGLPEKLLEMILMRHPVFEQLREAIKVTNTLEDGDRLRLKHKELLVIHCPGHSPGMINFYDASAKVLFSGDNLLKEISPVPLIHFPSDSSKPRMHSLADYLATVRRLKSFDIDMVLTGHGDIIHDVPGVIESIIVHHEIRKQKVLKFLDGSPKSAYEVCCHLFPEIDQIQIFLGMSEAVGHLDLLETEGAVQREEIEGRVHFTSRNPL